MLSWLGWVGLWLMNALHPSLRIVPWPTFRRSSKALRSSRVIPAKNSLHGCKYSTGDSRTVWSECYYNWQLRKAFIPTLFQFVHYSAINVFVRWGLQYHWHPHQSWALRHHKSHLNTEPISIRYSINFLVSSHAPVNHIIYSAPGDTKHWSCKTCNTITEITVSPNISHAMKSWEQLRWLPH